MHKDIECLIDHFDQALNLQPLGYQSGVLTTLTKYTSLSNTYTKTYPDK